MLHTAILFLIIAVASGSLCFAKLPAFASSVTSELTAISLAFSAIIAIACRRHLYDARAVRSPCPARPSSDCDGNGGTARRAAS